MMIYSEQLWSANDINSSITNVNRSVFRTVSEILLYFILFYFLNATIAKQ